MADTDVTPASTPDPPVAPTGAGAPPADLEGLEREMQRVAERARKDAEKSIRDQYGDSPDNVRKLREKAEAESKAKMDETERAKLEAKEAREFAEALKRDFDQRERIGKIKDALRDQGFKDTALRMALADAETVLGEDFDEKSLKDYVAEVTKALAPTAPSGVPGGKPPKPSSTDSYEAGLEEGKKAREQAQAQRPFLDGMTVLGRNN